jgi:hypothetical protein
MYTEKYVKQGRCQCHMIPLRRLFQQSLRFISHPYQKKGPNSRNEFSTKRLYIGLLRYIVGDFRYGEMIKSA